MSTTFDGDTTVSSSEVNDRIAELEEQISGAKPWKVKRDDFPYEEIAEFETEEEAEAFIEEEDYDPDRVSVEEDDDLGDERTELEELEEFRRDARSVFGNDEWNSGLTLTRGDDVDEDYVADYVRDNYGSWPDELDGFINWSNYLDYFLDGRECATLNGDYYYDL